MITLSGKTPAAQKRIAEETKNIYVPLAKRSGLRSIYHYLQALCMERLETEKWATIKTFVLTKETEMRSESEELQAYLKQQIWSKKIIGYSTTFLSPFSVSDGTYLQNNSWYAMDLIVAEP
jgi:(p)ppGpp synthase/HD superfamily hydrolase